jgi:hypothetical protein
MFDHRLDQDAERVAMRRIVSGDDARIDALIALVKRSQSETHGQSCDWCALKEGYLKAEQQRVADMMSDRKEARAEIAILRAELLTRTRERNSYSMDLVEMTKERDFLLREGVARGERWATMEDAPRDGTPVLVRYEWRACAVSQVEVGHAVVFWQHEAWHIFTGAPDLESEMFWPTCTGWQPVLTTKASVHALDAIAKSFGWDVADCVTSCTSSTHSHNEDVPARYITGDDDAVEARCVACIPVAIAREAALRSESALADYGASISDESARDSAASLGRIEQLERERDEARAENARAMNDEALTALRGFGKIGHAVVFEYIDGPNETKLVVPRDDGSGTYVAISFEEVRALARAYWKLQQAETPSEKEYAFAYEGGWHMGRQDALWHVAVGVEMARWLSGCTPDSVADAWYEWMRDCALHALAQIGDENARALLPTRFFRLGFPRGG